MNIKSIFTAAVALTVGLTACNKEESLSQDGLPENAVRITASVGNPFAATRSNPLGTEAEQAKFDSGDIIYVLTTNNLKGYYEFDGATWNISDIYGSSLKWMNDKQSFYAHYPITGSNFPKETVELDQSILHKINLSDLMYGELIGVSKGETLNFVMQRQTSRIVVKIGGFAPEFSNDSKVTDVKIEAKYSTYSNYYTPYEQGEGYKNSTYTLLKDASMDDLYIKLKVGDKEMTSSVLTNMQKGNSYTFNLVVGKEKLEIGSVTVADWSTKEIITGGEVEERS